MVHQNKIYQDKVKSRQQYAMKESTALEYMISVLKVGWHSKCNAHVIQI